MRTPHLVLAFLLLLVSVPSSSTVIRVDHAGGGDYLTIQEGIDAASEGDTVLVAPGTYAGTGNHDLDFGGTNIVVMSEAGLDSTVIECEASHNAFYFHTSEDTTSYVGGFRIIGDEYSFLIEGASPLVENCLIECYVRADGGAQRTSPQFREVTFEGTGVSIDEPGTTVFTDCIFRDGGGISCDDGHPGGRVEVRRCDFIRCSKGNHGGGMWCTYTETLLEDVLFEECYLSSPFGGMGAALCLEYGDATLDRVQFNGNWSQGGYGVLYLYEGSLALNDVVFWDNSIGAAGSGGSTYCRFADVVTITNSTMVGNRCGVHEIILDDAAAATIEKTVITRNRGWIIDCGSGATPPTIVNSCFFSNGFGDSLCGDYHDNLFVAPLFCDLAAGDFTLHDDSPCLPENNPWGILIGAYGAGGCGTGVDDSEHAGEILRVHAPAPTPGPGPVHLSYSEARPGVPVELSIYSVRGAHVRTLTDVPVSRGRHAVVWDGRDESGNPVASGVYYVKGASGTESDRTTLVILR